MNLKLFELFIGSQEYQSIEQDIIYNQLREKLLINLTEKAFLEIEELLHAEILLKIEIGFLHGYYCGLKEMAEE